MSDKPTSFNTDQQTHTHTNPGVTTMNTIHISFDTKLPSLHKPEPPAPSEAKQAESRRTDRQIDIRRAQQKRLNDMHPKPSDEQVADRWRILQQDHNVLMLKRISRQYVRGTTDREELVTWLLIDLAGARQNTRAAEAVMLLDSEDGARGRGRAHTIIKHMAHTRARSLITQRDREISSDFTEVQRQAVTASIKADGAWGKVEYDVARTINHELAKRSGDPLGFDRRSELFRRGSERISEMDAGAVTHRGKTYKASVHLHKERSLVDMLSESMRIGGLHDEGRTTREDQWTLKDWQHRFFTKWPHITDRRAQAFTITVMERAERLQTTKVRQAAALFLQLTPGAPPSRERLIMMDIVRGDITSLGKLVAAGTFGTEERQRKRRKDSDVVEQAHTFMQVQTTTILKLLGLDATSSQRESFNKLIRRMAIEAGATAPYDDLAPYKSQLGRFPICYVNGREYLSKLELATRSTGKGCSCLDKPHCPCSTQVRITSLYADRPVDLLQQGLPFYNEFAIDHKDRASWLKDMGEAACDHYLVYGSWPGCKMRAL